jgi:hypothetical protein
VSYALSIGSEAEEDLDRIVATIEPRHRMSALSQIMAELDRFACDPVRLGAKSARALNRPTFRFEYELDGCMRDLAVSYIFAPGENRIVITHVYRLQL